MTANADDRFSQVLANERDTHTHQTTLLVLFACDGDGCKSKVSVKPIQNKKRQLVFLRDRSC